MRGEQMSKLCVRWGQNFMPLAPDWLQQAYADWLSHDTQRMMEEKNEG